MDRLTSLGVCPVSDTSATYYTLRTIHLMHYVFFECHCFFIITRRRMSVWSSKVTLTIPTRTKTSISSSTSHCASSHPTGPDSWWVYSKHHFLQASTNRGKTDDRTSCSQFSWSCLLYPLQSFACTLSPWSRRSTRISISSFKFCISSRYMDLMICAIILLQILLRPIQIFISRLFYSTIETNCRRKNSSLTSAEKTLRRTSA